MEIKMNSLLENIIRKGESFEDSEQGISLYMVEEIFYIRDIKDIASENGSIINNYLLTLSKQKIRNLGEKSKKETLLEEMKKMIEEKGLTLEQFIDFIRKMKPVMINGSIMCHRVIT